MSNRLASVVLVDRERHLPSPYDCPQSCNDAYAIEGDGPSESVLLSSPATTRDKKLGDLGLGIGPFDGSGVNGCFRGFTVDLSRVTDDVSRTSDGIIFRGSGELEKVRIVNVKGRDNGPGDRLEAFGVRFDNNDPFGRFHGGNLVRGVIVTTRHAQAYVTGICMGTRRHPGIPLCESRITAAEVILAPGNHAGFTATENVTIEDSSCEGVRNAFYCDTRHLDGVRLILFRGRPERAAVGLAVDQDKTPKENLLIERGIFDFVGPGPFFGLEARDVGAVGGIRNITFRECIFNVPPGAQFFLASSDAVALENIRFERCLYPPGSLYYLPKITRSIRLSEITIDGLSISTRLQRFTQ